MNNNYIAILIPTIFLLFLYFYNDLNRNQKFVKIETFELIDTTHELGINHQHESFSVQQEIKHIENWYNSVGGASVSAHDFNNDGFIDLFFCNTKPGKSNQLYKNNQGKGFINITKEAGLSNTNKGSDNCLRPLFFDYNGDNLTDLFITTTYCHQLFKQNKDGTFTNVSEEAGINRFCFYSVSSNIFDYDLDGDIDIIFSGYLKDVDLLTTRDTKIMQNSITNSIRGGPTVLLKNNGNGTFSNSYAESRLKLDGWVLAIGIYDLNYDQFPDIWFAIDYNKSKVFINNKDGTFKEVKSGLENIYSYTGMGVTFTDLYFNKTPYAYVSQVYRQELAISGNQLFKVNADHTFENIAPQKNINQCGWSWGVNFVDLDNNTYDDILVANGAISGDPKKNYWYFLNEVIAAGGSILEDAKNWHTLDGYTLSGYESNCLFYNDKQNFINISTSSSFGRFKKDSRSVVKFDYDNNGSLDIVVTNQKSNSMLFKNIQKNNHKWIGFSLKGKNYNPQGIGSQIEITLE